MAFASGLGKAGFTPKVIQTTAAVHLGKTEAGFAITRIELKTTAEVPGIAEADFQRIAGEAKAGCPVSRALAGTKIELEATLSN